MKPYRCYAGGDLHDPASGTWINGAVAAATAAFRDGRCGRMMPDPFG